jgi:hypothetical protein
LGGRELRGIHHRLDVRARDFAHLADLRRHRIPQYSNSRRSHPDGDPAALLTIAAAISNRRLAFRKQIIRKERAGLTGKTPL